MLGLRPDFPAAGLRGCCPGKALMRLIAAICTLPALAAAGWSGQLLWQELAAGGAGGGRAMAFAAADPAARPAEPAPPRRESRRWPPLFGEPQPPRPAPAEGEPQPPRPPLASLGYSLRGLVQSGGATWAVLAHPAGARMVRAGDRLEGGAKVVRISAEGVWLARGGGAPELLGFAE